MLATGRAQCKKPLLDIFEFARVNLEIAHRGLKHVQCLCGLACSAFCRGRSLVEQTLSPVACALEAPGGAGEGGLGATSARELADCLVKGFSQPLGILQQRPPRRKAILLVRFGS